MTRGAPRGFTLLELLLAMALNLVLLAAITTATFVFLRGFQRADREVVEAQLARVIFSRLGQDLRELCAEPPGEPQTEPIDAAVSGELPPAVLRGSQRELQLLARNDDEPQSVPPVLEGESAAPMASPAWRIDYTLAGADSAAVPSGELAAQGLVRQRSAWTTETAIDQDPALAPLPEAVPSANEYEAPRVPSRDRLQVEQIADVRLRYYDGAEWRADWDSQLDGLPRAVEAVLLFRRAAVEGEAVVLPDEDGVALPAGAYRLVIMLPSMSTSPDSETASLPQAAEASP